MTDQDRVPLPDSLSEQEGDAVPGPLGEGVGLGLGEQDNVGLMEGVSEPVGVRVPEGEGLGLRVGVADGGVGLCDGVGVGEGLQLRVVESLGVGDRDAVEGVREATEPLEVGVGDLESE